MQTWQCLQSWLRRKDIATKCRNGHFCSLRGHAVRSWAGSFCGLPCLPISIQQYGPRVKDLIEPKLARLFVAGDEWCDESGTESEIAEETSEKRLSE